MSQRKRRAFKAGGRAVDAGRRAEHRAGGGGAGPDRSKGLNVEPSPPRTTSWALANAPLRPHSRYASDDYRRSLAKSAIRKHEPHGRLLGTTP